MEELVEGARVVAMKLRAIREGRAKWTDGCGDQGVVFGRRAEVDAGLLCNRDGTTESGFGVGGGDASVFESGEGDLITGGDEALGADFEVGVVDAGNLLGVIEENAGGPEGVVNVATIAREFRAEAAVKQEGRVKSGVEGEGHRK